MGILRTNYDASDTSLPKANKARLFEKVLAQYNTKLELMIGCKRTPEYIYSCMQAYGLEWDDLSSKLKEFLSAYAPKPKKAKAEKSDKTEKSDAKEGKAETKLETEPTNEGK